MVGAKELIPVLTTGVRLLTYARWSGNQNVGPLPVEQRDSRGGDERAELTEAWTARMTSCTWKSSR